jgi:hypothetical protein
MALISQQTTWSAGDQLTATALNGEFDNIIDALTDAASAPTVKLATGSSASGPLYILDTGGVPKLTLWDTGQVDIDIATGTAPLAVQSTTRVDNLNVEFLDGYTASQFLTANSAAVHHVYNTYFATLTVSSFYAPLWIVPPNKGTMRLTDVGYVFLAGSPTGDSAFKVEVIDSGSVVQSLTGLTIPHLATAGTVSWFGTADKTLTANDYIKVTPTTNGGHAQVTITIEIEEEVTV